MAKFKPGDKKPAGSGMKKGQITKKSMLLNEVFDEFNFCPGQAILRLITDEQKQDEFMPQELANIYLKLMEFKFPRRKAVEHTGADGKDLFSELLKDIDGPK